MSLMTRGKYRGLPLEHVPVGYLAWCVKKKWCSEEIFKEMTRRSRLESREGLDAREVLNSLRRRPRPSKKRRHTVAKDCRKVCGRRPLSTMDVVERVRLMQRAYNERTGGKWAEYHASWTDEKIRAWFRKRGKGISAVSKQLNG